MRYRVHSQDTDYTQQIVALIEQHSMHIPRHWEPMRPDEDHRFVDISTQSDEEYWGDLEGWQVSCSLPCGLTGSPKLEILQHMSLHIENAVMHLTLLCSAHALSR